MICVGYSKRASFISQYSINSLKEQNDRIRDYARNKSWKIEKFYEDKSDNPDSDIGFMKLRADGMQRMFDVVIVDSIYRCGKTVSYARELLLNTFLPAGINFIIIEDNINSFEMTREELAEYFMKTRQRSNIVIGISRRNENLVRDGRISKRRISYGYKLSDDETEIEIDEYAAGIIRRFFNLNLQGYDYKDICKVINDEGIEAPACYLSRVYNLQSTSKSNIWNKSICQSLRQRSRFLGCDVDIGYKVIHYPQIIDKETFDKVNEMHKGKTYKKKLTKRVENAFNRKIYYCNSDNANVLLCRRSKDETRYRYFHRKNKKVKFINYSEIEEAVKACLLDEKKYCEKLAEHLKNGGNNELIEKLKAEYHIKAIKMYELSTQTINGKYFLYKKYKNGGISSHEYQSKSENILNGFKNLNNDFHLLIEEMKDKERNIGIENKWINRFINYDENSELTKRIVNEYIEKIIVDDDKNIFIYLHDSEANYFPVEWRNIDGKKATKHSENCII